MSFFECDKCGGIPGVTHCCTDKRPEQPAQAGQVLTDEELLAMWAGDDERFMRPVLGSKKVLAFARAVLARVARVPMTPEETDAAMKLLFYPARNRAFIDGVEAAERHHGIVGEKGGA